MQLGHRALPETWDSIEAARYASTTDIYVPMSHFNVELGRVTTLVFKGFYTTTATVLKKVEIVNAAPTGWRMPNKLPSGQPSVRVQSGPTASPSPLTTGGGGGAGGGTRR